MNRREVAFLVAGLAAGIAAAVFDGNTATMDRPETHLTSPAEQGPKARGAR